MNFKRPGGELIIRKVDGSIHSRPAKDWISDHGQDFLIRTISYLIKVRWDGAKSTFILTNESDQEAEFKPQNKRFYEDVRWYFEDYINTESFSQERALDVKDKLKSHTRDIWKTLSSKSFLVLETRSDVLATIYIEEDLQSFRPDIHSFGILWELLEEQSIAKMHDPTYRVIRTVSSRSRSELSAGGGPGSEYVSKNHLKILLVIARSLNDRKIDIDPLWISKPIFDLRNLLPPALAERIAIQIVRPGTFEALKAKLEEVSNRKIPFDIVHFDLHGEIYKDKETEEEVSVLRFLSSNTLSPGKLCNVPAKDVSHLLRSHSVKAVVLNACNSADPRAHLAGTFVESGIPIVLASPWKLHVGTAETMMIGFYEHLLCRQMDFIGAARYAREGLGRSSREGGNGTRVKLLNSITLVLYVNHKSANLSLKYYMPEFRKKPMPARLFWTAERPIPVADYVGDESQPIGRNHDILNVETQLCLAGPILRLYGLSGVGKTTFLNHAMEWWKDTGFVEKSFSFDFEIEDHSFREVFEKVFDAKIPHFTLREGESAEEFWGGRLENVLSQTSTLLVFDSFEYSQSHSQWMKLFESLQKSKSRSYVILAQRSMNVRRYAFGPHNTFKSCLLPRLRPNAAQELAKRFARECNVRLIEEDPSLGSLEELTLMLGCIPSAIKSFIEYHKKENQALNTADSCRLLLERPFGMDSWKDSPMPGKASIHNYISTAPAEMKSLVFLLGSFSKRIPLDPAQLLACQALCVTKSEDLFSGITADATSKIEKLKRKIQGLLAVTDMSLVRRYENFIQLLSSHGFVQFGGPGIDHLSPLQDMNGPDSDFGEWIYINPLFTDFLRRHAQEMQFDHLTNNLQKSFGRYREVLVMGNVNSDFLYPFMRENILTFIPSEFATMSAFVTHHLFSLLNTSLGMTFLHSEMIIRVMETLLENVNCYWIRWSISYNPNSCQQRRARRAISEIALGLCTMYAGMKAWPQVNQYIEIINQLPAKDEDALSERLLKLHCLQLEASDALGGSYEETDADLKESWDLGSVISQLKRQIRGLDSDIPNDAIEKDFIFRPRKLVASLATGGGRASSRPIQSTRADIGTGTKVKYEIMKEIEQKSDFTSMLKLRTELAIVLCKERNYWEAVDELVHLLNVIDNISCSGPAQIPSRKNLCLMDQIAFVLFLYGHVARCLSPGEIKKFALHFFSACSQLCAGGYSWTQRVLRLSSLSIICSSGLKTGDLMWRECIEFLDLFYSKPITARRLAARGVRYGEDFDGAEEYLLFGAKPRQAVYFLERWLLTQHEGAVTKIDLNNCDRDYIFRPPGSPKSRAGLFFMIIFFCAGGVNYDCESDESIYSVLAQENMVKDDLIPVLTIDDDELCIFLCIVSTFMLAILLVNDKESDEVVRTAILQLAAEAEVIMFGDTQLLREYPCIYFKNTLESEQGLRLAAISSSERKIEFSAELWQTEAWKNIRDKLVKIEGLDLIPDVIALTDTENILSLFGSKIPEPMRASATERALKIFGIETPISKSSSGHTSEDVSDDDDTHSDDTDDVDPDDGRIYSEFDWNN